MLHVIYAELVNKYGWSPASRSNPDGKEGNVVWMHLFIDSFAIQPCGPTCKSIPFFSVRINTDDEIYFAVATARDAWIQADKNRYNGANGCLLWKVFASRGLGTNAKTTAPFADGFGVPAGC